jgi:acylphosphatase
MSSQEGEAGPCCRRVIYVGRVQGVGFRYTTSKIARRHLITGYVRNLADGTVELLAQGTANVVQSFLDEVSSRFDGNIDPESTRIESMASHGDFSGFEIRR